MNFTFTGKLHFNSEDSKNPWYKEFDQGKAKTFSCAVVADDNNRAYVDLYGGIPRDNVIKTYMSGKDGGPAVVDWENRFDPGVVNNVASFRRHFIKVNGTEHYYIADYDAVEELVRLKNGGELDGKVFTVSGDVQKSQFNGKVLNRFVIRNLFETKREEGLRIFGEVFFTADGIDLSDWKTERQINLTCYTRDYVKDSGMCYVPMTLIYKETNPIATEWELSQLGIKLDGDTPKVTLKKKAVYSHSIVCNYFNGTESRKVTEDDLTPMQLAAIRAGKKTLDDFSTGRVYGNRIQYIQIVDFDVNAKKYVDGILETDIEFDDFESQIFSSEAKPVEEKPKQTKKEEPKEAEPKVELTSDDLLDEPEDIF